MTATILQTTLLGLADLHAKDEGLFYCASADSMVLGFTKP